MFFSYSFLTSYLGAHGCQRYAFLRRLLGVRAREVRPHLKQGQAIDDALADLVRGRGTDDAGGTTYGPTARKIARRGVEALEEAGLTPIPELVQYPVIVPDFADGWEGFEGFVDLVCRDRRGRVWVVDAKAPNLVYGGTLRHDSQLMLYHHALEQPHETRIGNRFRGKRVARDGMDVYATAQLQILRRSGLDECELTGSGKQPSTSVGETYCTWERWAETCVTLGHDPAKYEDRVRPKLDARVWARVVPHESEPAARRSAWLSARFVAKEVTAKNRRAASLVGDRRGLDLFEIMCAMYPPKNEVRGPRKGQSAGWCNVEGHPAARCELAEHCHAVQDGLTHPNEPEATLYRIRTNVARRTQ